MKARSKKRKGTRLEQWVQVRFAGIGWHSRRQPGSGIYQDFPHDVHATDPLGRRYVIECKSWKQGWRTGDKAMGAADILVIKRDFGEPCVYMPWSKFEEIVSALAEPMPMDVLRQYRDDMLFPPSEDSRERRIEMIDAVIAGGKK